MASYSTFAVVGKYTVKEQKTARVKIVTLLCLSTELCGCRNIVLVCVCVCLSVWVGWCMSDYTIMKMFGVPQG